MKRENKYLRKRFILLPVLAGVFIYLFYIAYRNEKADAVTEFNLRQTLLAKQAADRIGDYFSHYYIELNHFSDVDNIVDFNREGINLLLFYWSSNTNRILSVTRMDESGKIIYTLPDTGSIGKDISNQPHVKKLLKTHKPVISNIFKAVQGFSCVAYHVPLFDEKGIFKGSVAILVKFDKLVERYLTNITISGSANVWVINNFNSLLYDFIPDYNWQLSGDLDHLNPEIKNDLEIMTIDQPGALNCKWDYENAGSLHKLYAIHYPVKIADGFWSIIVATPREEILATTKGFRNILALILFGLSLVGILYSYYFFKAWTVYKETEYAEKTAKERNKMEVSLRQTEKLNTLGLLASSMAHEINNPMMGIINYADLIKDKITDENLLNYADGIIEEGHRISNIVKNILGFSRQKTDSKETATLGKIFNDTILLIGSGFIKSKIDITKEFEDDLPAITCRPNQLKQVLLNLLINAKDALNTHYGDVLDTKKIFVKISTIYKGKEKWQQIIIEDNGPGIEPSEQKTIFQPFYSTKPKDEGTGLGLPICIGIIEEHLGAMSVESTVGEFTRFIIELPLDA